MVNVYKRSVDLLIVVRQNGGSFANMPGARRQSFEQSRLLLPELLHLGHHVSRHAGKYGLEPHEHPSAIEICFLYRGVLDWWVGDQVHHLTSGRVFVTQPGEPHGGVDDALHACELFWLQVRVPKQGVLPGLPRAEMKSLSDQLTPLTRRSFSVSPAVNEAFAELIQEHVEPRPLGRVAARAALHRLLVTLLRDAEDPSRGPLISSPISDVMHWLRGVNHATPSVADMADRVGMSVTHFHRRFAEEVGLTPGDWITRQRIAKARARPSGSDDSVTQIAMDAGFGSSQSFATCFRRITGLSPSEYRSRQQQSEQTT